MHFNAIPLQRFMLQHIYIYMYIQYILRYSTIMYNSCYVILLYFPMYALMNNLFYKSFCIDLQMTGNLIIIAENCETNNKSLSRRI